MTIISGVVGGVDSVAKEIKINKLEKQIQDIKKEEGKKFHGILKKNKGKGNGLWTRLWEDSA